MGRIQSAARGVFVCCLVLFADTEGSFMTDRLIDLASAAVQRVQPAAAHGVQQNDAAGQAVSSRKGAVGACISTQPSSADIRLSG